MSKYELAVKLVADEFRTYIDFDSSKKYRCFEELANAWGLKSPRMIWERIREVVNNYAEDNGVDIAINFDFELETESGEKIHCKEIRKAVAKELFK